MVQTNQMISYLNKSVNVQKQETGKASKSDDGKTSFSEALDREISAKDKPAAEEKPKTEDSQMKENTSETHPEEAVKQIATVIPWTMQPQLMQQNTGALQQHADTAQIELTAENLTAIADGDLAKADINAAGTESMLNAVSEKADSVLFAGKLQNSEGRDNLMQQMQPADEVNVKVDALKQDADVNSVKNVQQMQTEVGQQVGQTELISQNMQTQAVPQQTVEIMQASKPQTVDMSNMKQGLENLAKTMSEQITQGKNEFEIWLEPANLGKMAVKVAYEGGKAMLSIICMSEKTLEIVSQNAKNLGAILQQNTGTDTVIVVEERHADYLQQNAQQQGGRQEAQNEQQQAKNNEQEAQQESFLQQLRLGLMQ